MQERLYRIRQPSNPILQFFALVAAALIAVGAILLGAIVFTFFLGLAVIGGLVLYIRLWWLRRRSANISRTTRSRSGDIVEVEYTVVRQRSMSNGKQSGSED